MAAVKGDRKDYVRLERPLHSHVGIALEPTRGPRGPALRGAPGVDGRDGRDGRDGKDAKVGDIGSSDTIYVPIFARVPDVEAGTSGINANNWDDTKEGQVWLGVTPVGGSAPTTPFYFSYSDVLIATDSSTGQPVVPYPGEKHPKGYRLGDLLGEPLLRTEEQDTNNAAFYFNFRATLMRAKNSTSVAATEGTYRYWFSFEPFTLSPKISHTDNNLDEPEPPNEKAIVNLSYLVKNEYEINTDLSTIGAANSVTNPNNEPVRDAPLPADTEPDDSEFAPHVTTAYRVMLISRSDRSVVTATASTVTVPSTTLVGTGTVGDDGKTVSLVGVTTAAVIAPAATITVAVTGASPVVLSHSVFIPELGYNNLQDTRSSPSFHVRVLPRSTIEAYIGIEIPRRHMLPYIARVNATISSCKTKALVRGNQCTGRDGTNGMLTFLLEETADCRGFHSAPPDTLAMRFSTAPARSSGKICPGITLGLPVDSPHIGTFYQGRHTMCLMGEGELIWEDACPMDYVALGPGPKYVGFSRPLYNSGCEWNASDSATENCVMRIMVPFYDIPPRTFVRHRPSRGVGAIRGRHNTSGYGGYAT